MAPISLRCSATAPVPHCSTPHQSISHAIQRSEERGNPAELQQRDFFESGTDDCRAGGVVGRCAEVDVVRSTACNPTHENQQESGSPGQGAIIL